MTCKNYYFLIDWFRWFFVIQSWFSSNKADFLGNKENQKERSKGTIILDFWSSLDTGLPTTRYRVTHNGWNWKKTTWTSDHMALPRLKLNLLPFNGLVNDLVNKKQLHSSRESWMQGKIDSINSWRLSLKSHPLWVTLYINHVS